MSSVNEAITGHLTVGDIRRRYGINVSGPHSDAVTLTSVADALEDITPGALYLSSSTHYDSRIVHAAAKRGAYAIAFMISDKTEAHNIPVETEIPVIYAALSNKQRAGIASELAGNPAQLLAVFAVQGSRSVFVMRELYDILHYLGNPLGVIDHRGGVSLDRELWLKTPLSPLDVQRMLYVMVEDGATSVIVHVDDSVLEAEALSEVGIDIYGNSDKKPLSVPTLEVPQGFLPKRNAHMRHNNRGNRNDVDVLKKAQLNMQPYGAIVSSKTRCVDITEEAQDIVRDVRGLMDRRHTRSKQSTSDQIEQFGSDFYDAAAAVAMVLETGMKKTNVKSALRMAYEMRNERK